MARHDTARFSAELVFQKCHEAKDKINAKRQADMDKEKARWLNTVNSKLRVALRFGKVKTDADAEQWLDEDQGFGVTVRHKIGKWRFSEDEDIINAAGRLAEVAVEEAIGREMTLTSKSSNVIEAWRSLNV